MRERWLGATGRRVPEIAVEGDVELPDDVALARQADADRRSARRTKPDVRLPPAPTRPKP